MRGAQGCIQVELKTVTPLFLAGADPRGEPELRAASVRGALRFWLRALLGGVLGDHNFDALRQAESAVFGSTKTASPVVVRVEGNPQRGQFRPLLHNPEKTFRLHAFEPEQSLKLTLAPRICSTSIPEVAVWCLLVWLLLGGLGKRSRRGFGSFMLASASQNFPLAPSDYASYVTFAEKLQVIMRHALAKAEAFARELQLDIADPLDPPQFPILHQRYAKVLLCEKPFSSWEEAMKAFWELRRSNEYRKNRVFGLAGNERQASPLHLRIVKVGEGYHPLFIAFRMRFAGEQPSWQVMQNFLDECRKRWQGRWVFGGDERWT